MSDYSDSTGAEPAAPAAPGLVSSASAPAASQVSSAWAQSEDRDDGAAPPGAAAAQPVPAIELTAIEARVLGSMIEKSFQTPDVYPMTTNALTNACNQKSNRDPVVDYSAVQVDSTLLDLRQRNLVRRVHSQGSRSTKHRQTLDETLALTEPQLVVMSVLLLRGDQTMNELRIRTERHDVGLHEPGAIEDCLESLASRPNPIVRQLPRQSGHKENRWRHLIKDGSESSSAEAPATTPAEAATPAAAPSIASTALVTPSAARAAVDTTATARIEALEQQVSVLQRQLASLADKLGESLDDLV